MGVKYTENTPVRKWQGLSGKEIKKSLQVSVGGKGREARERRLRDKVKDKPAWSMYVCACKRVVSGVVIRVQIDSEKHPGLGDIFISRQSREQRTSPECIKHRSGLEIFI